MDIQELIRREIWSLNEDNTSFDVKELKNLNSFAARKRYVESHLSRIKTGSGRGVYDLGNKVLKLAKNTKGVAQNEVEAEMGHNDYYAKGYVTEVFEYDEEDYQWLIAEKAKKLTPNRFKELTGVNISDLSIYLMNNENQNNGRGKFFGQDKKIEEQLDENEFSSGILDMMFNYDLNAYDLGRISTYGEVIHDGQPDVVIIDYGLTRDVWNKYYDVSQKNRYYKGKNEGANEGINEGDPNYNDELENFVDTTNIRDGGYAGWALLPNSVSQGGLESDNLNEDIKSHENLALGINNQNDFYYLYNPKIKEIINNFDAEQTQDYILGGVNLRFNKKHNGYEINTISSRHGYGPLLYLIGMTVAGNKGLMPSREKNKVSDEAKMVWKEFYQGKGKPYIKEIIELNDNIHQENFLNKKYVILQPIDTHKMYQNHLDIISNDSYKEKENFIYELSEDLVTSNMRDLYEGFKNSLITTNKMNLPIGKIYNQLKEWENYHNIGDEQLKRAVNYIEGLQKIGKPALNDISKLYKNYLISLQNIDRILPLAKNQPEFFNKIINIQALLKKIGLIKEDLIYWHASDASPESDNYQLMGEENDELIKENVAGLKQQEAIEIVDKILDKFDLNKKPKLLGSGLFGYAFDLGDRVLKLTTDQSEAVENLKIKQRGVNRLPIVYGVYEINREINNKKNLYVIFLEKLNLAPEVIKKYFDNLDTIFLKELGEDFKDIVYEEYIYNKYYYQRELKTDIDRILKDKPKLLEFYYAIIDIADEIEKFGIQSTDFLNYNNLGFKNNGKLGTFDIGYGDYYFGKDKPTQLNIGEGGTDLYRTKHGFVNPDDSKSLEENTKINTKDVSKLEDMSKDYIGIVSTYQPKNKTNKEKSENLKKVLDKFGFEYIIGMGEWDDDPKTVEQSFIIQKHPSMSEDDFYNILMVFARKFNQETFIFGKEGDYNLCYNNGKKENLGSIINFEDDSLNEERIKSWMPGMSTVSVKKKCKLGGKGDGTSVACNQGDIKNLDIKPLKDGQSHKPNKPNVAENNNINKNIDEDSYIDSSGKLVDFNPKEPIKYSDDELRKIARNVVNKFYKKYDKQKKIINKDMQLFAEIATKYYNETIKKQPQRALYELDIPKDYWKLLLHNGIYNYIKYLYDSHGKKRIHGYDEANIYYLTLIRKQNINNKNENQIFEFVKDLYRDNIEYLLDSIFNGRVTQQLIKDFPLEELKKLKDRFRVKGITEQEKKNIEEYINISEREVIVNEEIKNYLNKYKEILLNYRNELNKLNIGENYKLNEKYFEINEGELENIVNFNQLNKGVDADDEMFVEKFPINKLSVSKRGFIGSINDIRAGKPSKTNEPIKIFYNIKTKQFLVADGYHRVAQAYLDGKKYLPAYITSNVYSDYIATIPDEEKYLMKEEIIPFNQEEDEYEIYDKAIELAKENGLNILSDKNLSAYVIENDQVIGALFDSVVNGNEYSFDIVIDKKYQNKGYGKSLVKYALDLYNEYKEIYGENLELKLDVINPNMRNLLKKHFNFKDIQKIGNERYLMKEEILSIQQLPFKDEIYQRGGKIYSVGGAVRDEFLGKESKDLDILITGIPMNDLSELLKKYGKVSEVGESFGIIKFKPQGSNEDIDIALPRTEIPTGQGGHKGFDVKSDHSLSIEDDLIRRDFTINAIAKDIEGNVIDPFDGQKDLQNKLIRVVNPQAFSDDPLRMLRAIQFSSRFDFNIESNTMEMIQKNAHRIKEISPERILIEFEKIVNKGDAQEGAVLLKQTGLFKHIFGKEGSVLVSSNWNHVNTMGEFIWLLSHHILENPAEYYKNQLNGDVDTYKEIKAYEIAFNSVSDNQAKNRLVVNAMYGVSPQSLESKILPQPIQKAVQELKSGHYPLSLKQLAINGNDLIQLGFKGQEIGKTLKNLLFNVYSDKVKNNKENLLNLISN